MQAVLQLKGSTIVLLLVFRIPRRKARGLFGQLFRVLRFWVLGFRVLGLRVLGFRVQGFWV